MILNFKDFLLEGKLEKVLESGLVAGKFDFSDLTKAISIWISVYEKMDVPPDKYPWNGFWMFMATIKDKKIDIMLSPRPDDLKRIASYTPELPPTLDIYSGFIELDTFSREIAIAHEFSHAIDPSLIVDGKPGKFNRFEDKSFWKYLNNAKNYEEAEAFMIDAMDKMDNGDSSDFNRLYMRQTTEVEAHVGMLVYALNSILLKDQSKLNELKSLLSRGDWNVDSIFPELKPIMDRVRPRVEKFGKVVNKLKKRLGALVSTIQEGEKISFKLVVNHINPNNRGEEIDLDSDFYEKVKSELIKEKIFDPQTIENFIYDSAAAREKFAREAAAAKKLRMDAHKNRP
jgi:hypothetical protein